MGEPNELVCIDPTPTLTFRKKYTILDVYGCEYKIQNDNGRDIFTLKNRFATEEQAKAKYGNISSPSGKLPFGIRKEVVYIIPESDKYEEERCDTLGEAIINARERQVEEWLESVTEPLDYMNAPNRDDVQRVIVKALANNPSTHLAQLMEILGE